MYIWENDISQASDAAKLIVSWLIEKIDYVSWSKSWFGRLTKKIR